MYTFSDYFGKIAQCNRRRAYDLLSAIRGPDSGTHILELLTLKARITARIRSVVFAENWRFGFPGTLSTQPILFADMREIKSALLALQSQDRSHWHYIHHLKDAVLVSRDHEIWGGYADHIARMCELCVAHQLSPDYDFTIPEDHNGA